MSDELTDKIGQLLAGATRNMKAKEDQAFSSAIELAEDAHSAFRALIGLMADNSARPGEGGMVEGVRRNDMVSLLRLVNDRFGDAVTQARHATADMPSGGSATRVGGGLCLVTSQACDRAQSLQRD